MEITSFKNTGISRQRKGEINGVALLRKIEDGEGLKPELFALQTGAAKEAAAKVVKADSPSAAADEE